jgi:dipeptidase
MNQWGVTMACNWMWSKEENQSEEGIRRYAIRQLILERAKTAQDAVKIIADFIEQYGQADWGGLDYVLADPNEAWIVETTTHHWVARKIKDDEILVIANRFTIGKDYDKSSKGLIEFAQKKGWYDPSKGDFSFRDAYGRPDKMDQAYDKDRETRVMALFKDKQGVITPEYLFLVLRDRYEGTPKYTKPLNVENWREMSEGRLIPRTISNNLTQSSSVAHLRSDMPVEVGSVMWYSMVGPQYSGYFPVYAGATTVPDEYSNVNSAYSPNSAWWTSRMLQKVATV